MAKWVIESWMFDDVTCSACGAKEDAFVTRSHYGGEWAVHGESKFCPTCGARMDGTIEVDDAIDNYWWGDDENA